MHFRILKMIATSGFLTAFECTKFDFDRGSPDPLDGLRGPTSKGKGGKETERSGGEGGEEVGEGQRTGAMEVNG